jgi:hypothetical protein
MFRNYIQNRSLPSDQSEWLIKFDPLLKLTLNYQENDIERLLEDIAHEAFLNGYHEILDLFKEVRFIPE